VSNGERPLSPHMFIYRWPMTMTVSILHRASGIGLSLGLIALVAWLAAVADGAPAYDRYSTFMQSLAGRLLLALWSFAFFFHLANGVRHLFWDGGLGFEIPQANASGWVVIASTFVLTLAYWLAL
jgi:succinate dehydrogenase / fumarate reductase, cytochrome b subunit